MTAPDVSAYGALHTVRKCCVLQYAGCLKEWDGPAFSEQPAGARPLPGVCRVCGAIEDAELARRAMPPEALVPELRRPRRTSDLDL